MDSQGQVQYSPNLPIPRQIFSSTTTQKVVEMMKNVVEEDGATAFPPFQEPVGAQENVVPGEPLPVLLERPCGAGAGLPEFVEMEAFGHRHARVGGMQDGKRYHDGARPSGHLVQEIEGQQDYFGRDAGAILARIKVEEAEIDLDVAVGRLNAAHVEDAVAQAQHAVVGDGNAGQLESEIRFDGGADFRRSAGEDVEAAVGELAIENRAGCLVDEGAGFRLPHAVLRRIEPELEQNVVGFEGGIGAELGAPVAVALLQACEPTGGPADGRFRSGFQRVADLYGCTH